MTASVTPDFRYDEVATHRKLEGIGPVLEAWKGWAAAFPDTVGTLHSAVASGNTVVLEVTWNGTHTGTLVTPDREIPATGKSLSIRAIFVNEVEDGKVASSRQYFDMATMMSQLGVS